MSVSVAVTETSISTTVNGSTVSVSVTSVPVAVTVSAENHAPLTLGTPSGLSLSGQALSLGLASAGVTGALSGADWSTFNGKAAGDHTHAQLHDALTLGTANGLSLTGQQLTIGLASAGVTGALSGTDWSTFNAKAGLGLANVFTTTQLIDLSSDVIGLRVQMTAGQTQNPLQVETSLGAVLVSVDKDGDVLLPDNCSLLVSGTGKLILGNTNQGIFYVGGDGSESIMQAAFNDLVYGWLRDDTGSNNILFRGENGNGIQPYFYCIGADAGRYVIFYSLLTLNDGVNISLGTSTGTKIGTVGGASGQKLGFWNATPIVQPVLATGAGATADNIITVLQNLGLVRQS